MAGRPMKFTETKPARGLRRGQVGMRTRRGDLGPSEETGYYNVINPNKVGAYVIYEVADGEIPKSYTPQNDTEFIRCANQLGGSAETVNDALTFIAGSEQLTVGSLINTTGSTDVNPFMVYDALGTNPSDQDKWYNTKAPDNISNLNVGDTPQHCLNEFVCVKSQNNAIYCAPYTGTRIFELSTEGTVEEVVSATSGPQRGTFNVTAGHRYAANKPIHLYKNGQQAAVIPGSLNGTNWGFYYNRNEPITIYLYAYDDCKVTVFTGTVSNANTFTKVTVPSGSVTTFQFPDDTFDNTRINLWGTKPFLCSVEANGADRSIASIAGPYSFRRDTGGFASTIAGASPSNTETNVVYDSSLDTWAFDIADGQGSDSEQSVPNTQINKNYCFGNVIDNYTIVNPNSAQSVIAEYYSGGAWVTFAEHSLSAGSNTEPTTANTGSSGDLVSGANIWRWRGEHPFCLVINDSAADEEALYGWNDGDVEAFFL